MTLSELSVRRPVLAAAFALLILVVGIVAALRLPVREYPDVDPPQVSVSIVYPGASAAVVERDVTQEVEDNLNGIDDVELIESTSRNGFSQITIEFDLSRDLDAAAADVRDRVSAVRNQLPEDIEEPVIRKSAAQAQAMMWITLTSDKRDRRALSDFADRTLKDPLSILPGVSQVLIGGERRFAMRIWLDAGAMAARGVTVSDVVALLRQENIEAPAGRIETDTREFTVRATTKVPDAKGFGALVLKDLEGGQVRLSDVARIELGAENDRSAVFRSGEPAIGLGIIRQSGSNTLAVAERVRSKLSDLSSAVPDDIEIAISYDQSVFIEGSIQQVIRTLLITVSLVIAVVYLSLGSLRGTLLPASTIPVSIVGTFAVMLAADFSINTLTMLALVLAIGLVVDDAIVVLENVTRRREEGDPPLAAAVRGAQEVFLAVIATTLVLAAVLLPIAALTGFIGKLFTEFAVTLAAAVIFSSFLALSLGAMLASKTVKDPDKNDDQNRLTEWFTGGIAWVEDKYDRMLIRLLKASWAVVFIAIGLGSAGYWLYTTLPGALAPTEDRATFIVPVSTPEGATLGETTQIVRQIEEILDPYRGNDGPIEDIISIVGTGTQGPAQVTSALVIVKLRLWGDRNISQQELVQKIVAPIGSLPGAQAIPINPASLVPSSFGKPIQLALRASDYDTAYQWAQTLLPKAQALGTMRSLEIEYNQKSPQIRLNVKRDLASELGLSVSDIGQALRIFLGGEEVSEFYRDGQTYEVVVRGVSQDRQSVTDIGQLELRTATGEMVPLANVIETQVAGSAPSLRRINRQPSVIISAVPAEGADLGSILASLNQLIKEELPAEAQPVYLGLSREFSQSDSGILVVFALGLATVYLTLAALFSSFLYPLVIMLTVPLAVTSALAAVWAAGLELTIFSQIGLLLAVGLLAKNAILLVDFANQKRAEGAEVTEAISKAAKVRFRPVVMTSIATLFGAIPLALASGPGAESRSVIGITIIAGVIGATFITFFIVPGLYALLGQLASAPGTNSKRVDEQLANVTE